MSITPRPKSSAANGRSSNKDINKLVNKGGSPSRAAASGSVRGVDVGVLLRIPEHELLELDALVSMRAVRTSRHMWLLEAVHEKILRERQ